MSESTSISAEIRENNISAKILRKSGEIPAIVYGQENDPKLVKILEKDLVKILENPSIFSQVIELNQNDGAVKVILKEVQVNPSNDRPIHVDFHAVSEKTNITINVPLKFINEDICLEDLRTSITTATQQLAKRQVTWMNKFKIDYRFTYPENNYHSLSDYIKNILN